MLAITLLILFVQDSLFDFNLMNNLIKFLKCIQFNTKWMIIGKFMNRKSDQDCGIVRTNQTLE